MNLREYLRHERDPAKRQALAEAAGTTVSYFWQIAGGHTRCSAELAVELEKASGGMIQREDIRPELFLRVISRETMETLIASSIFFAVALAAIRSANRVERESWRRLLKELDNLDV